TLRPLTSTLFPYTTLFRSSLEIAIRLRDRVRVDGKVGDDLADGRQLVADLDRSQTERVLDLLHDLEVRRDSGVRVEVELDHDARSEEHTSELQSQSNLVCR